jgi:hypothetical protein
MKRLLPPGVRPCFRFAARWAAVLLLVPMAAPGQESAPSRTSSSIELPVSDQAKPFIEPDSIIVAIGKTRRNAANAAPTSVEVWRASIGFRSYKFDASGLTDLKDELYRLGYDRMRKTAPFVSERGLLIRADAEAPWRCVQLVIEQCAHARVYRIWAATASHPAKPSSALECWLPIDTAESQPVGSIISEIRVLLSWNSVAGKLERLFGQLSIAPTFEGDRKLEELIRDSRLGYEKVGETKVPLILDVGPSVPWQSVVTVMTIGKRAGVGRLEFGFGEPTK